MIFELLDAKRRRINTYQDNSLIEGVVGRELVDRVIKDSLDIDFTLNMLGDLKGATYVLLGDTNMFRVNPIFKIADLSYDTKVNVTCTSQTLDEASGITAKKSEVTDILTTINQKSESIGYLVTIDVDTTPEELTSEVLEYLKDEFTLQEAIEAILQVVDGYAEFDASITGDYVSSVELKISDRLGTDIKDALIYGENIAELKVDERIEGIVTAVEYTGREVNESGDDDLLTLDASRWEVPTTYTLPNTKREAKLTEYTDGDGVVHYLLEDVNATRTYGRYTTVDDRVAEPLIEVYSNTDIPTIEDLVDVAIKALDGKSVPQTQYSISTTTAGVDVADNLGIRVPHLGIDRYMPVLSVSYWLDDDGVVDIKVGEHLPTEIEKQFEKLPTLDEIKDEVGSGGDGSDGDLPIDLVRGTQIATVIEPRTLTYTGDREEGVSDWEFDRATATWVATLGTPMMVSKYDYYLSFDYVINGGYSDGHFSLGLTYQTTARENKNVAKDNAKPLDYVQVVADVAVEGTSGNVEIRLNDFYNIQYPQHEVAYYGNIEEGTLEINSNNIAFPIFGVYDSSGSIYYLPYLHRDKQHPTTQAELDGLAGYITNFTIVGNERNTVDPT